MRRPDKNRLFFFIGLLAIAVLYSAYNLYILDPDVYETMTRGIRHLFKFGSVLIAWAIGGLAFRKSAPAWLLQLWRLLYAGGLALLLLLAACDSFITTLPMPLRKVIGTFHEFLISPIPYIVIGILNGAQKNAPPPQAP